MRLEFTDKDAGQLLALRHRARDVHSKIKEALESGSGAAIAHWGEELRRLNEQAGAIVQRAIEAENDNG